MGRIIGGVVGGYAAMFAMVMALFSVLWMVMGPSGAFKAESWDVSMMWVLATIALGIVAAIAGGYVCVAIANDGRAIVWLIGVVLVLGVWSAIATMGEPGVGLGVRPESMGMFEAMSNARQPTWVAFLNPLLGVVGTLIGARMRGLKT